MFYLLIIAKAVLLYTLAMAQLLNAEADCFQDCLDLSAVAAKEIVEVFLVNV